MREKRESAESISGVRLELPDCLSKKQSIAREKWHVFCSFLIVGGLWLMRLFCQDRKWLLAITFLCATPNHIFAEVDEATVNLRQAMAASHTSLTELLDAVETAGITSGVQDIAQFRDEQFPPQSKLNAAEMLKRLQDGQKELNNLLTSTGVGQALVDRQIVSPEILNTIIAVPAGIKFASKNFAFHANSMKEWRREFKNLAIEIAVQLDQPKLLHGQYLVAKRAAIISAFAAWKNRWLLNFPDQLFWNTLKKANVKSPASWRSDLSAKERRKYREPWLQSLLLNDLSVELYGLYRNASLKALNDQYLQIMNEARDKGSLTDADINFLDSRIAAIIDQLLSKSTGGLTVRRIRMFYHQNMVIIDSKARLGIDPADVVRIEPSKVSKDFDCRVNLKAIGVTP
jgi:hypothetical protein